MLPNKLLLCESISNICWKSDKPLIVWPSPHARTHMHTRKTHLPKNSTCSFQSFPTILLEANSDQILLLCWLCSASASERWGFVLLPREASGSDAETSDREKGGTDECSEGMGWPHTCTHSHTDVQYVCRKVNVVTVPCGIQAGYRGAVCTREERVKCKGKRNETASVCECVCKVKKGRYRVKGKEWDHGSVCVCVVSVSVWVCLRERETERETESSIGCSLTLTLTGCQ